jgi:UDP-N-acetyl-D-glucosamine dehydrogenase
MTTEVRNGIAVGAKSVAPDGTVYPLPALDELRATFQECAAAAAAHREQGGQVVAVQGLGFVGAAVAATVASATLDDGRPAHFVVGVDLATPHGYWKVAKINDGEPPFRAPDSELERLVREGAQERRNLRATTCEEAYGLADVIIVDVHLDVENRVVDDPSEIRVALSGLEAALRAIARHMRPDALVLIETTVPMGTCERIALPILREERRRRGITEPVLLAHAYERVMPGPAYVDSIRAFPRTFAGIDKESADRARAFLSSFIDTRSYPLWELGDTVSSELAKLLENSYRSLNIAFIHEWTLLAEKIGINLFEVVHSIRERKGTHDNMRYPGFGVGGYCLTKDSLLAQWGAANLFENDALLAMTLAGLKTNFEMPLHTLDLVREVSDGDLAGKTIVVCGVSYIAEVADTRNSPTETLLDGLLEHGATVRVHDPHVVHWVERPEVTVSQDFSTAVAGADGVVFAVPHAAYVEVSPEELADALAPHAFVVDAQDVVTDDKAEALHSTGCRILGVGKGHWRVKRYEHAV